MGSVGLTLLLASAPYLPFTLPHWGYVLIVLVSLTMLAWSAPGWISSKWIEAHMTSFGMTLMVVSTIGLLVGAVLHYRFPSFLSSPAGEAKLDGKVGVGGSQTIGQSAHSITNNGPVYNTQVTVNQPSAQALNPAQALPAGVRLQVSCSFNPHSITRFALVNIGDKDLPYSARILTRPGVSMMPGRKATGTVKANSRLEIPASEIWIPSQGVRATVIFDVAGARADISGECIVIDATSGAQQVVPMTWQGPA